MELFLLGMGASFVLVAFGAFLAGAYYRLRERRETAQRRRPLNLDALLREVKKETA